MGDAFQRTATATDPASSDTASAPLLLRLARIFLAHHDAGSAEKLLTAAAAVAPTLTGVVRLQALAAYRLGRHEAAVAYASSAARNCVPGSPAHRTLSLLEALSLKALGRDRDALRLFAALAQPGAGNEAGFDDGLDGDAALAALAAEAGDRQA